MITELIDNAMDLFAEYDKIRPYNDAEVPEAIQRVLSEERFKQMLAFLYRDKKIEDVIQTFKKIKTVSDFQLMFSHYAVREVVRQTSDGLSYSGIDKLDNTKPYLFISNHRDIVLDSAILQILLVENNHNTSQITFGSNLMSDSFIIDLGKLNKMFNFYRGGSRIQLYKNAVLHSEYIRHVITKKKESLWIAQRDGRTKDGNDKTQIALIKMLLLGKKDLLPALKELNIVPLSISYEYEPCDAQKVQELYLSKKEVYKKQKGEDFVSVLSGIKGYKGHIHMGFGSEMDFSFDDFERNDTGINEFTELVINKIDNQIYKNYKLWPGNYIAFDMLNKTNNYSDSMYNIEQKKKFINFVDTKISTLQGDKEELASMLIHMYAMPVINRNLVETTREVL
ncbi:acyltransferase [Bacteroidota bacterium]